MREYFSHDYHARQDPKIIKLLRETGQAGYGIYWSIVESLYQNANALPLDYDCIAYELRVESELVKKVIDGFDLFIFNGAFFYSESVARRLNERMQISIKASKSAKKRWSDAFALRSQCQGNAIKEKETKEKEIKVNLKVPFKKPSLDEIREYFAEQKTWIDPEKFWAYYESKGWKDIKNWKACLVTFEKNDKKYNKSNPQLTTNLEAYGLRRI